MNGTINMTEAIRIFRRLTGRRISHKYLEDVLRRYRHLAVYDYGRYTSEPKLVGVRRHNWEYFVATRKELYGARHIFNDNHASS